MEIPKDARAIVTGAGSGFGRAVSVELGKRGGRVIVSDVNVEAAEETARMIGGGARAMRVDVRDPEQVKAQVDAAVDAWGGVDVLVNNAGVAVVGRVGEVSLEDWRFEMDVNLMSVIYGCHYALPVMRKQKRGWVLNVASAAGLLSAPNMGPYNVTKAGVIALSETLAGELLGEGVSVSVLCPTFFQTNIHKSQRSTEQLRQQSAKLVTGSKWTAEQVARVALKGLERGTLYIIPQRDGKLFWGAKRVLGAQFYSVAGRVARRMGM
jgi:NAD(P)-dependent dehydrogenase (short-subunit alcohol dehydrogenase family)